MRFNLVLLLVVGTATDAFLPQFQSSQAALFTATSTPHIALKMSADDKEDTSQHSNPLKLATRALQSTLFAAALALSTSLTATPAVASDSGAIVSCLVNNCKIPFAKCITNPKCMANVICINTCNDKEDETGCQIQCGDLFDNDVIGEFNKCAVSAKQCVPQKQDTGDYPAPADELLVKKFDTKLFNGRWYITAGQNPLFDTFPCQVHFFEETAPGTIYGKLNWRIEEPDGEFFTRDALQRFVQDPAHPAILKNHDNEYLHYQDDWYILDFEYDDNKDNVPPFAFVYYRGSNDAWDGYGGVVVYTRASHLPDSLLPRLREAAAKVNFDFDKDFKITDNTCQDGPNSAKEKFELREQFAGKVLLQTEQQLQAQATKVRGNAVNLIIEEETILTTEAKKEASELAKVAKKEASELAKVAKRLEQKVLDFEQEVVKEVSSLEQEVVKDVERLEQEVVKEVENVEKEVVKDTQFVFTMIKP